MNKWISASRLRTLPLSLSGIFLGTLLAKAAGSFNGTIFLLACLCTLFLQILSNFANDYGDGIKGTDAHRQDGRLGEKRAVASGAISATQMKNAVKITAFLSVASAILLLAVSFLFQHITLFIVFLSLGAAAVWAAIQYTVGSKAYGYMGLGDVFVLIFFGWVAVAGTYVLYCKTLAWEIMLPATAVGLLSAAVLNLNNMRDIHQDVKTGKNTLPVKLGFENAKKYHSLLLLLPFVLATIFEWKVGENTIWNYLFLLLLIPTMLLLRKVHRTTVSSDLDSELKKTALLCLGFALLLGLGNLL